MDNQKMYLLDILKGKWRLVIIEELFKYDLQFNELKSAIHGISSKVLADNLIYLMQHGIVHKKTYPIFPVRTVYTLTDTGRNMKSIINAIYKWSIENYQPFQEETNDDFYMIFSTKS